MKIGIIGHGYCGQATEYLFSNYIIPKPEIAIHDPDKGHFIRDWSNISYAFICVPTNLKGDKLDTSIIDQILKGNLNDGEIMYYHIRNKFIKF